MPKNKNLKIVYFGNGDGRITIPILKKGFKVITVYIDKEVNKRLKKLASKLNLDRKLIIEKI